MIGSCGNVDMHSALSILVGHFDLHINNLPEEQTNLFGYGLKNEKTHYQFGAHSRSKMIGEDHNVFGMEISTWYKYNIMKSVTDHYSLSLGNKRGEHKKSVRKKKNQTDRLNYQRQLGCKNKT